jgi:hypothetical protein
MKIAKAAFWVLALVFSVSAHADRYLAISLGTAEPDDSEGIEDDSAFIIGYGLKDSEHFGYQISYVDLGELKANDAFIAELNVGNPPGLTLEESSISITGFDLSVLGFIPLSDKALMHGRIGLYIWNAEFLFETNRGGFTVDDDGNDLSFGVGLDFGLSERASLTFGYDQYEVEGGALTSLNAGIKIGF